MATRAGSIRSSTPKQPGTPSRTDRTLSVATVFQSSPGVNEALIEVEGHTDQVQTTVGNLTEFLPFQRVHHAFTLVHQLTSFRQLLETEVTIQFGPKLKQKRTVHLELLKCYSKHVKDLFDASKSKYEAYQQGKIIRTQVKALLPPETPTDMFAVGGKESSELVKNVRHVLRLIIGS
jgi:hypothetical protein